MKKLASEQLDDDFREEYVVSDVISYSDEESGSEIISYACQRISSDYNGRFWNKSLGTQNATLNHISDFKKIFQILEHLVFCMNLKLY